MDTFFYDFKQGQTVNPFDGVTHFYVSPYQMDIWKTLNLADRIECTDTNIEVVIQHSTGIPVLLVPITALNLGKCMVKLNEDFSGRIYSGKKTIYFRSTEQDSVICITTVC
jgi:hypothetical protein